MNFTDVDAELKKITAELSDSGKVALAGVKAADIIRKHLYEGEGFEPLGQVTKDYRGDSKGRPLLDTGHLRDSFTAELVNKETVSVGTTVKYAPIQNNGGVITAKKEWLFIPGPRMRYYERKFGRKPGDVLNGLRSEGFWVYRAGRAVFYREKEKGSKAHVAYYLKKSVEIPKREFFYLTDEELNQITEEVADEII